MSLQYITFAKKNLSYMDIKVRIEDVISQKGLTKKEVAERMGKFNQAFNSLITNPKWDTIELVAQAIGITTEELLFGEIKKLGEPSKKHAMKVNSFVNSERHNIVQQDNNQSFGVIICPFCGKGIKLCLEKG